MRAMLTCRGRGRGTAPEESRQGRAVGRCVHTLASRVDRYFDAYDVHEAVRPAILRLGKDRGIDLNQAFRGGTELVDVLTRAGDSVVRHAELHVVSLTKFFLSGTPCTEDESRFATQDDKLVDLLPPHELLSPPRPPPAGKGVLPYTSASLPAIVMAAAVHGVRPIDVVAPVSFAACNRTMPWPLRTQGRRLSEH